MGGRRGHRAVPHTADVILEAWAPDVAGCLEEAVAALVGTYAELAEGAAADRHPVRIPPGPLESQLVSLLDEVLFTLDTAEGVPVGAEVEAAGAGGFDVVLWLAPPERVEAIGPVPKAVSRSELAMRRTPERVWCRFLVDV